MSKSERRPKSEARRMAARVWHAADTFQHHPFGGSWFRISAFGFRIFRTTHDWLSATQFRLHERTPAAPSVNAPNAMIAIEDGSGTTPVRSWAPVVAYARLAIVDFGESLRVLRLPFARLS